MILASKGHSDAAQGTLHTCTCEMVSCKEVFTGFLIYETASGRILLMAKAKKEVRIYKEIFSRSTTEFQSQGRSNSVIHPGITVPYLVHLALCHTGKSCLPLLSICAEQSGWQLPLREKLLVVSGHRRSKLFFSENVIKTPDVWIGNAINKDLVYLERQLGAAHHRCVLGIQRYHLP